jgi:aryl sulfotransferase
VHWLKNDGSPWWPFWQHIRSWWDIRDLPNVKLVHFANLKADLEGGIREIAEFLGISRKDSEIARIAEYCSFDWMKSHAKHISPWAADTFHGGPEAFINKGTNGRWMSVLTEEEKAEYEATAVRELGEACAHWLATGEYLKQ